MYVALQVSIQQVTMHELKVAFCIWVRIIHSAKLYEAALATLTHLLSPWEASVCVRVYDLKSQSRTIIVTTVYICVTPPGKQEVEGFESQLVCFSFLSIILSLFLTTHSSPFFQSTQV